MGEITPQNIITGPVSSFLDTPPIGLIVGGEYIDDRGPCDTSEADVLGYDWILDSEATSGTDIPFYDWVFVAEGQGRITDIVVGNPAFIDEVTVIPPTVLDAVPRPVGLDVGTLPNGPAVGGRNATFEFTDASGDTSWTGEISAVVSATVDQFADEPGRCFLVLGSLTPTAVDGLTTTGFDTPAIGTLVGGRYVPDSTRCETDEAEADGFDWILNAEVTVGTEFLFYAEIFVPEAFVGNPTHVIVGRQADDAAVFEN